MLANVPHLKVSAGEPARLSQKDEVWNCYTTAALEHTDGTNTRRETIANLLYINEAFMMNAVLLAFPSVTNTPFLNRKRVHRLLAPLIVESSSKGIVRYSYRSISAVSFSRKDLKSFLRFKMQKE
jgi:hypothetical protein